MLPPWPGPGALAGHRPRLWPAGVLGSGTAGLSADRLSGLFLLIAFGAATWCRWRSPLAWAGPAGRAGAGSAPATRWPWARWP